MWKIDDTGRVKESDWKLNVIAVTAIIVFIVSIIFFVLYIVRCINGEYDLEEGFFRCMGVIGIFLTIYAVLGLILKQIE